MSKIAISGDSSGTGTFTIASPNSNSSYTITLPTATTTVVGTDATQTLTNKTLTFPTCDSILEKATISATSANGTVNFDFLTQPILYYTSNAGANFTLNIRGDSTNTTNSKMAVGQSLTIAFLNTNGATAYYANVIQIDGSTITPKWQNGTPPTAGNASSIDAYTFSIVKTAETPTYVVLGSLTKYA